LTPCGHTLRSVVVPTNCVDYSRSTSRAARQVPPFQQEEKRRRRERQEGLHRPSRTRGTSPRKATTTTTTSAPAPVGSPVDAPNIAGARRPPATSSTSSSVNEPASQQRRPRCQPDTVGAITVLIVVVAVFLAYNANHGLPFVPTYKLSAEVPTRQSGRRQRRPHRRVRVGDGHLDLSGAGAERLHQRRASI